ncbi:MAG TPA: hypothetical protein VF668_01045 [Pyrinomonadaceae bacterium]|jgi:hypothetical protein
MNDAARRTLRELIAGRGTGLCSDARRCEGLLRDLCGEHRREINILVGALRERVPLDLLAAKNSVPTYLLVARLAKRLEEQLALTEDAARWAVDSWALALGVVTDAELEEFKRRRDETPAPPLEATPRPSPPAPPPTRPGAPPLQRRTPAASTPPAAPPRAAPASGTHTPVSSNAPAPTAARKPSSPQGANTSGMQEPAGDAAPRGGRTRWRGCLVGCLLLALLSALLAVGVPFVVNTLREEQQRRNLEPPAAQTP